MCVVRVPLSSPSVAIVTDSPQPNMGDITKRILICHSCFLVVTLLKACCVLLTIVGKVINRCPVCFFKQVF